MEETTYTAKLPDGTVLPKLMKDGDYYISKEIIDISLLENPLSEVTIEYDDVGILTDGNGNEQAIPTHVAQTVTNWQLLDSFIDEETGYFHFSMDSMSEEALQALQIQANIDYVAMMSGIEL